jgi:hypothetical protein
MDKHIYLLLLTSLHRRRLVLLNVKRSNKKAELIKGFSFGSSAILLLKTRRFPPPSREGLGFIGKTYNPLEQKNTFLSLIKIKRNLDKSYVRRSRNGRFSICPDSVMYLPIACSNRHSIKLDRFSPS